MNPFNANAGDVPYPVDPAQVALAEEAAQVIWRLFPYFAWRYGERGRAFGRSDAGYLVTLAQQSATIIERQVDWLMRLLAPRGMPSVLLEYQLEALHRAGRRHGWADHGAIGRAADGLRRRRRAVMHDEQLRRYATAVPVGPHRHTRGIGAIIAGAACDAAQGVGDHSAALLRWLEEHGPDDAAWQSAVIRCAEQAEAALRGRSL